MQDGVEAEVGDGGGAPPPPPPAPPGLAEADVAEGDGEEDEDDEEPPSRSRLHSSLWPARHAARWQAWLQYFRCRQPEQKCSAWSFEARVWQNAHSSMVAGLSRRGVKSVRRCDTRSEAKGRASQMLHDVDPCS